MFAIAAASGLWYGAITWVAFRAGNNWEALLETIGRLGGWTAAGAAGLLLALVGIWYYRRRHRR
jgi:LPXTG-motif cell wall-anchored protein